ncbi:AI-2E family transporter [Glycocaulis sp.]|uniref:AI-2E family transporter n=1 Tax=Glycocaulis sp. TaxID=1969725 RepID=UPI0025C068D5|nr:AI-2E family transporter [Glycocaulis sp.]MCH8521116.1 AI-2E family transporter [Glycocaulis sp.]
MADETGPYMPSPQTRAALQRVVILVMALTISVVFVWMVKDFLGAVFLAAVLALLLTPLQAGLARRTGNKPRLAAALLLIATILIGLLPFGFLAAVVIREAVQISEALTPFIQEQVSLWREAGGGIPEWVPYREQIITYQAEIAGQIGNFASTAGRVIINALTSAAGSTLMLFLNIIVFLYALYFFLVHGRTMTGTTLKLLPMRPRDRILLLGRAISTIRATVKGTLVIGIVQGSVTGIALAIAGVPGAAFWGALAGLLSVIPGIGTPLVWGPAAAWLIFQDEMVAGVALTVFGFVVIMNLDNFLRPRLVGRDARMSDLMVLISTLGGLTLFGAMGIIIGPMIAALFSAVWHVYARAYAPLLGESPYTAGTAPERGGGRLPPA